MPPRIEILKNPVSSEDADDLNRLFRQLSSEHKARSHLTYSTALKCAEGTTIVAVVRSGIGRIAATATLVITETLRQRIGHVEDVVVDDAERGKGSGEALMRFLINKAREFPLDELQLTSNPSRAAARALYLKLGFKERNTTCFELKFEGARRDFI